MKSLKIVACALVLLIASSCGSAMKSAWVKEGYSGRNFEKILVIAISRNAENTAVTNDNINRIPQGWASTFLADQIATNWNTPQRLVMATITIIPVNSPSVLKSTPAIACCWFSTPSVIISPAPIPATMARLIFSVTITA